MWKQKVEAEPSEASPSPWDDRGMSACRRGTEPTEEVLQGLFLDCLQWIWAVWCCDCDTQCMVSCCLRAQRRIGEELA